ncbi:MAG: hypothetical protein ACTSRZ_18210, partial [Promethearchaeota archaeon]
QYFVTLSRIILQGLRFGHYLARSIKIKKYCPKKISEFMENLDLLEKRRFRLDSSIKICIIKIISMSGQ